MKRLLTPHVSAQFMSSERASELYVDEVLAGDGSLLHVDKSVRVTALEMDFDLSDEDLEEQCRRHLHAC